MASEPAARCGPSHRWKARASFSVSPAASPPTRRWRSCGTWSCAAGRSSVALTRGAREFVAPLTFAVLSRPRSAHGGLGPTATPGRGARGAGRCMRPPARRARDGAHAGKLRNGLADDFLSTYSLAHHGPRPARARRWNRPCGPTPRCARTMETSRRPRRAFVGPTAGFLASGHEGLGRMAEPGRSWSRHGAWPPERRSATSTGLRLLVSAGPHP